MRASTAVRPHHPSCNPCPLVCTRCGWRWRSISRVAQRSARQSPSTRLLAAVRGVNTARTASVTITVVIGTGLAAWDAVVTHDNRPGYRAAGAQRVTTEHANQPTTGRSSGQLRALHARSRMHCARRATPAAARVRTHAHARDHAIAHACTCTRTYAYARTRTRNLARFDRCGAPHGAL